VRHVTNNFLNMEIKIEVYFYNLKILGKVIFVEEELGELRFYIRKIPLHQQKYLVVSVLSNLPWCREI